MRTKVVLVSRLIIFEDDEVWQRKSGTVCGKYWNFFLRKKWINLSQKNFITVIKGSHWFENVTHPLHSTQLLRDRFIDWTKAWKSQVYRWKNTNKSKKSTSSIRRNILLRRLVILSRISWRSILAKSNTVSRPSMIQNASASSPPLH